LRPAPTLLSRASLLDIGSLNAPSSLVPSEVAYLGRSIKDLSSIAPSGDRPGGLPLRVERRKHPVSCHVNTGGRPFRRSKSTSGVERAAQALCPGSVPGEKIMSRPIEPNR
jgi:hypothetical protein